MDNLNHEEKREFLRVDHEVPIEFKSLSAEKLSSKKDVLLRNISASGLLFRSEAESAIPPLTGIIWIKLDEKMLNVCNEIEEDLIQFEGGVFARVVRISEGTPGESYDIGVSFLRKKNMTDDDIKALTSGIDR
ncbi:MAG: PilZ domain-containing protein [Candidatus Omnitrophota bacterium]